MRITHVNLTSSTSAVDGISSVVDTLTGYQQQRGLAVTVLNAQTRGRHPGSDWEHLRASEPEVVHLHSAFRPRHVQLSRKMSRAGIPYVISPHSAFATAALARQRVRKAAWIAVLDRRVLTSAQAVICLTPAEAAEVRRVAPSATAVVVPNPQPVSLFDHSVSWRPTPGTPHVVTLARFDVYQKGLDRLAQIAAHMPEVRFTAYGQPDHNAPGEAARLIAGAPPNLTFCKPVHGADKTRVFTEATMFIQPSRWEGMSMALLEAFAHGIPAAVSTYVFASLGHAEVALELPDDPAAAARRLVATLDDPKALTALGSRGRAWMRATTAPDVVIPMLMAAYRRGMGPLAAASREEGPA